MLYYIVLEFSMNSIWIVLTIIDHYLNIGFNELIHETQISHTPTRAGGNQGPWVSRACLGTLSGHPRTPHVL